MKRPPPPHVRNHADDIRAATKLVIEATTAVTDVVEEMHRTIASGPAILGRPLAVPARLFTGLAYGPIRRATRLVGVAVDRLLEQLAPLIGEGAAGPEREALVAVLNGVLGDYLSEIGSPLATEMRFRQDGHALELEAPALARTLHHAGPRPLVLVHGSSMTDGQWARANHDHGAALARDLGYTPVYLHYNSGLHISTNGRSFAHLLERLTAVWPLPIEEIAIVGHSMGGLVARSACHEAEAEGLTWRKKLTNLLCIGSPHHGASLERWGNWVDTLLGISAYSAPLARLGKIRSAGVTDLRFGNVLDEHWQGRERFAFGRDARCPLPLPEGVASYAIAGTTAKEPRAKLPGDGIVSVESALGRHEDPALTLGFPEDNRWIAFRTSHLDLLSRPEVYETVHRWLARPGPRAPAKS